MLPVKYGSKNLKLKISYLFRYSIATALFLQLVGSLTATLCACLSETDPSAYNALDHASMPGKYDSRYMPFAGSYAYRLV